MTHLVETEVRNEVKEELEMFMRGKFQGGEFIFRIFMDKGTYFTNQDYFENRKNFLANIDEEHFVKIELVSDDQAMQKLLVNQMHPSVSIIQISKDSSNSDYQSNIINRITTNENTIEEIRNLIRAINTLSITDKDIIIARGILGIGLVQLAEHWKKKPETLRRCYIRALDSLAFTKGLLNF